MSARFCRNSRWLGALCPVAMGFVGALVLLGGPGFAPGFAQDSTESPVEFYRRRLSEVPTDCTSELRLLHAELRLAEAEARQEEKTPAPKWEATSERDQFELRRLDVTRALSERYPQAVVSLISSGLESIVFSIAPPDEPAFAVKVAVQPSRVRVQLAFVREKQISDAANHPNVVHIRALETIETTAGVERMLVLDKADGSLASRLASIAERNDPMEILDVWMQITSGLQAIHQTRHIHLDVKPQNILVKTRENEPTRYIVADLGLARRMYEATPLANVFLGTISHASENQLHGRHALPADDLYGLRVTFIEILSGATVYELVKDPANKISHIDVDFFGRFPRVEKIPEAVLQRRAIHPLLRAVAETQFTDVNSVIQTLRTVRRRIQSGN